MQKSKAAYWSILKGFFVLLFCLFFSTNLLAQKIAIQVQLEEEPAIGASIQLFDAESNDLLDFCYTDQNGDCSFLMGQNIQVNIRAKYFGYQDTTITVQLQKNKNLDFTIHLQPVSYDLPDVSVVDKIIGLKQRGDTISFNLRAYTSGTEKTLGDVLSTLPGVEVDRQGNIKVKNEKIDALFINGRDIINEQHRLATEGIHADIVEGIEMISNFKNEQELFEEVEDTDKMAINVLTQKNNKSDWQGNLSLLGGTNQSLTSTANLTKTNKSSGWAIFLRQNNIGADPLSEPTHIAWEEKFQKDRYAIERIEQYSSFDQKEVNGSSLNQGLTKNNDYQLLVNGDTDFGKLIRNKSFFTFAKQDQTASNTQQNRYIGSNIVENTLNDLNNNQLFASIWNKSTLRKSRHFIRLLIQGSAHSNKEGITQTGNFDNNDFSIDQATQFRFATLKPTLSYSAKISKTSWLNAEHSFDLKRAETNTDISSSAPFLGFETLPVSEYNLTQSINYNRAHHHSALALIKRWGRSNLTYRVNNRINNERFSTELSDLYEGRQDHLKTRIFQHGAKAVKDWDRKVRLLGSLTHVHIIQNPMSGTSANQHFLFPSILLSVEYFRQHSVSLSFMENAEYHGIQEYNPVPEVDNSRQVTIRSLNFPTLRRTRISTLSFFKKALASGGLYNISMGWNQINRPLVISSDVQNDFVNNNWVVTPSSDGVFLSSFFLQSFKKWKLRMVGNWNVEDGFAVIESNRINIRQNLINLDVQLSSIRWKGITWKVECQYRRNSQKILQNTIQFSSLNIGGVVEYAMNNWHFEAEIFQQSRYATNSNHLTVLDMEIVYTLPSNNKWRFLLKGNNLFNFNGNTQIELIPSSNVVQLNIFNIFPGQILGGVGYYF